MLSIINGGFNGTFFGLYRTNYVDYKYGKIIQLKGEDDLQNYASTKIRRDSKFGIPKQEPPSPLKRTNAPPPGEIKNGKLLKRTKDRGT